MGIQSKQAALADTQHSQEQPASSRGLFTARRVSWSAAILSSVAVIVGFVLAVMALQIPDSTNQPAPHLLFSPIGTFSYTIVGALIATQRPRNPIGWLFVFVGILSALTLLAMGYATYSLSVDPSGSAPGLDLAIWTGLWVWVPPTAIPLTFLLLLFPNGKVLSPRWRPAAWAAGLGLAVVVIGMALHPGPLDESSGMSENPYGIVGAEDALMAAIYVGATAVVVSVLVSVVAVIIRFRRSRGVEREQLKWLAYAGVFVALGFPLQGIVAAIWPNNPTADEVSIIITGLTTSGIVVATGIAILRHRLYDIDVLINRTLLYGILTVIVVGLYVVVVGGLGTLVQARGTIGVSLVATGLVAVAFEPLRGRLQRGINRLMYGERDDPYAVLSRLGHRLEATIAPDAVLPTVVETAAQALKLPYVAIALEEDGEFHVVTAFGSPVEEPFVMPLSYQMDIIGQLICAPRSPGEPFNDAERQLLQDVARQAGVAVHAVRLTGDLQRSRERLVATREEERRRLRRDLHDGLGPQIASQTLTVNAIEKLLDRDPGAARDLLDNLKIQLQDAVVEIRRLVYDLRPPALDELGLTEALREGILDYQQGGLEITLDLPDSLPPLPAAVEVAAYRIAHEAITNVVRHAQAQSCVVHLSLEESGGREALCLEVTDDGKGLEEDVRAGVGLQSMRERVAELGGDFEVAGRDGPGTRVLARLPLPQET